MSTYIYIYMHTKCMYWYHSYLPMYIHILIETHSCLFTDIHTNAHAYRHTHQITCIYIYVQNIYACMHYTVYIHVYIQIHMYIIMYVWLST